MAKLWIDQNALKSKLADFFSSKKDDISTFGNTVNQTFEAYVFASVVNWYRRDGWKVEFKHPGPTTQYVKLKFNTRGRPSQYTYALCTKDTKAVQVRHAIRVATKHHRSEQLPAANVVLDVAVIQDQNLSGLATDDHIDNTTLITFGEAKHMSAFAELIANFIGLVHEMKPEALCTVRPYIGPMPLREHTAPFLYVSGNLYPTAQGLVDTIRYRGYDIDVFDQDSGPMFGIPLNLMRPQRKTSSYQK